MYSQQQHQQQRQRQQQQQQQQQQQNSYPIMNTVSYAASTNTNIPYLQHNNNMYNQPNIVRNTPTNQAPPPPPPQHHHGYTVVPPEPVPSATDTQPTPPLSIPQLADFASTVVFLMWHARRASVMALHDVSMIQKSHTDDQDLGHSRETANIANCKSSSFKKFCEQILTATQLSESVILLSLKYIAMLLQNNPNIQGADGSEYRLFTVALMLANKFLDDNTFTNKTWSDVSGMKVTDLNIMELEFLDVLRFKLFVRFDEYERWKMALLQFKNQLQNANEVQKQEQQQQLFEETFKGIVSPTVQHHHSQHYLLMLSKAQQPHYPTQPPSRPLTRVPLRIPHQPVWRTSQTVPVTSVQAPMYDTNNTVPPTSTRPYLATSSTAVPAVSQHSTMPVMVPSQAPTNSDYYSKMPVYDSYAPQQGGGSNNNGGVVSGGGRGGNHGLEGNGNVGGGILPSNDPYYQQVGGYNPISNNHHHQVTTPTGYKQQQQQQTYSQQQSMVNNASSRLSGMNLSSQTPDFNTNQSATPNSSYFYLTPPNKPTTPDNNYYPRQRNSYYDIPQKDYLNYDISNDIYSQQASAYQQQQFKPQYNAPPQKKYNGPTLEDPLTAAASYRKK